MKQVTVDITSESPVLTFTDVGIPGPRGLQGFQGAPFTYSDFTQDQLDALKGEPFRHEDFTPEQLQDLKGDQGDKGDAFTYSDFTSEQLVALTGPVGPKMTYADLSASDKADLSKGVQPEVDKAKHYADTAEQAAATAQAALAYEGEWDASSGAYPAHANRNGLWKVVGAGTVNGVSYEIGSELIYHVDNDTYTKIPSATAITGINGYTVGDVVLTASDVGARPNTWVPSASEVGALPASTQLFSGNYLDLQNIPLDFTPKAHRHPWSQLDNIPNFASRWPSYAEVTGKPDLEATYRKISDSWSKAESDSKYAPAGQVLFSGSYNDLTDKPVIPSTAAEVGALGALGTSEDSKKLNGKVSEVGVVADSIVQRDVNGDIRARLYRSSYNNQTTGSATAGAGICFRNDTDKDSFMRFLDKAGMLNWLGRVNDSSRLLGKTLDQVVAQARSGLVPTSRKVNNKPLSGNVTITKADVNLGNVANLAINHSSAGNSRNLYASQAAAYEAAAAPRLEANRKRLITQGTADPTGGVDNDIYIQYK